MKRAIRSGIQRGCNGLARRSTPEGSTDAPVVERRDGVQSSVRGERVGARPRPSVTGGDSAPARVAELDGLRAIAILLVLLIHFWRYPIGYEVLNRFARTGWVGVDLFFVLSGYLITGILWRERRSVHYYRNFYARRVLRIFPLYYLLLFGVFVIQPLHRAGPELLAARAEWPLYVAYLANVPVALHGWRLLSLDITWSLAIEEQFYLCWPLGVRRLAPRPLIALLTCVVIGVPILRTIARLGFGIGWIATFVLTVFRVDSLAIGALVALCLQQGVVSSEWLRHHARWVLGLLGPGLLVFIATGHFERSSLWVSAMGYSLVSIFFAGLLVWGLSPSRPAQRVLGHPLLRRIGIVSYGIYILHPLCLTVVTTVLARLGLDPDGATSSSLMDATVVLLCATAFAYGVAEISFRLFEQPILRLKDRFRTVDVAWR